MQVDMPVDQTDSTQETESNLLIYWKEGSHGKDSQMEIQRRIESHQRERESERESEREREREREREWEW